MGELVFWNAATGRKKRIVNDDWGLRRVIYSADGKFLAACDFGGSVKLLEAGMGKTRATLTTHPRSQINSVAISPDSRLIAGGSFDGRITLWDSAGKEQETFNAQNAQILSMAISPDGQTLVAGCRGKAFLFDLAQGGEPKLVQAYAGNYPAYLTGVEGVAFAPDGKTFATGGVLVRLWETATGNLIRNLPAGSERINALAFSPDGQILAGVDRGGHLRLWSASGGGLLETTQAHPGASFGIAFSPNGEQIATVGRTDLVIKIWKAQPLQLLATFYRTKAGS